MSLPPGGSIPKLWGAEGVSKGKKSQYLTHAYDTIECLHSENEGHCPPAG